MARKSTGSGRSRLREDVADRLHCAAVHLLRRLRREDARAGLSVARLSALSLLVSGGSRTLGELAQAEQVTAPTMSRIVTALEREKLVRRRAHPEDRRAIMLEATARGQRVLEQAQRRRLSALVAGVRRLPTDDVQILGDAARIMEELAAPPEQAGRQF